MAKETPKRRAERLLEYSLLFLVYADSTDAYHAVHNEYRSKARLDVFQMTHKKVTKFLKEVKDELRR